MAEDKFKGYKVAPNHPKKFLYKGDVLEWKDLTPAKIKELAEDPNWNSISLSSKSKQQTTRTTDGD